MAEFIRLTKLHGHRALLTSYYNVSCISSLTVVSENNDQVLVKLVDDKEPFWVVETLPEIMNAAGFVSNNAPEATIPVIRRIRE